MPKIHPRVGVLAAATSEAQVFVAELVERHGLSYAELFSALAAVTGAWATLAVREERAQSAESKRQGLRWPRSETPTPDKEDV